MFNLSSTLEHHARQSPSKEAIVFADKRISYAQLNAVSNQIANGLIGLGIGYGDKVALTCPNLPYFPMIYFGILKTGASVVPLSVLLKHIFASLVQRNYRWGKRDLLGLNKQRPASISS